MIGKEKYKLIKYEDLTPSDFAELQEAGILNGYGGARQSWIVRWIIGRILKKFSIAIAYKHDYSFFIGGDIERFHECNRKFFDAMVQDMWNIYYRNHSKLGLSYNLFLCLISFLCTETFGKKYFSFTKKSIG